MEKIWGTNSGPAQAVRAGKRRLTDNNPEKFKYPFFPTQKSFDRFVCFHVGNCIGFPGISEGKGKFLLKGNTIWINTC